MFVVGVVLFVTVVPYFAVLLVAGGCANIVLVMGVALVVDIVLFLGVVLMLQLCWLRELC